MKVISLEDLARMRLGNYVGKDVEIEIEESGMIGLAGLGGWERLGETYFAWRQGEDYQIAGIELDLGTDSLLPRTAAEQIIKELGLPIEVGMTAPELLLRFGVPFQDKTGRPGDRLLDFICGERDQFVLNCIVGSDKGLTNMYLLRKDYYDDQ